MATKATFSIKGRNPDVLTCIANLSNDEVFTPPDFANQMLNTLQESWAASNAGENIWANPNLKFLDPFTKSGVFLREIVSRLTKGLADEIPDLQSRVDHILSKQVYGIGVTELTSLLARRSVYCSKYADGEHSIATSFKTPQGNIWFERTEHTWVGGTKGLLTTGTDGKDLQQTIGAKCKYCGATQTSLDRGSEAETHAYAFIHTDYIHEKITEIFGDDMHFDVIIGNPPYQLDDGGFGASAAPIYNKFVDSAKALDPRMICMVIPARWFAGGKGLDDFRAEMLNDSRIREIHDYPDASEVFPGVSIKGGICYFLWDRDNRGDCTVTSHGQNLAGSKSTRPLLEKGSEVFIRYNEAIPILKKIIAKETSRSDQGVKMPEEKKFSNLVSSRKHFGLQTSFRGKNAPAPGDVKLYQNGGIAYVSRDTIVKNIDDIDAWKVFIPIAGSGSNSFPDPILGKPFVGEPGSASTETYNLIGPFSTEAEARNVQKYIQTRFMRFLVLLHKPTQHSTKVVFSFVPKLDFSKRWDDNQLYARYEISAKEQDFIQKLIRPMEIED